MGDPVRIFVGCAANHEDLESQVVLEYTLRKYASVPIEIIWMQLSRDPQSPFYSNPDKNEGWITRHWATPFSGFRWAIPAICNYTGYAIYFDSDFILQADIAELAAQKFEAGKVVIAKRAGGTRYCCSYWDCTAAQGHCWPLAQLQRDSESHGKMTRYFATHPGLIQEFAGGDWNVMDIGLPANLADPKIKAIHYTQMEKQLHLRYAVPRLKANGQSHWYDRTIVTHERKDLLDLFDQLYAEAQAAGFTLDKYQQTPVFGRYSIRGK